MSAQWKAVVGYEGIYEVSDLGAVRSLDRRDTAGRRRYGRELAQRKTESGHRQVTLCAGSQVTRLVHHLVLEAFVGPRPEGTEGCHGDGDPSNNAVGNLRWGTRSSNVIDMVKHGVHPSSRKVTCKRGHPLEAPNLMPSVAAHGHRGCLACNRAQAQANSRGITATQAMFDEAFKRIVGGAA